MATQDDNHCIGSHKIVGSASSASLLLFTTQVLVERILSFVNTTDLLLRVRHANSCCLATSSTVLVQRLTASSSSSPPLMLQVKLWTQAYECGLVENNSDDNDDQDDEDDATHAACDLEHGVCCNTLTLRAVPHRTRHTTQQEVVEQQVQTCLAYQELGYFHLGHLRELRRTWDDRSGDITDHNVDRLRASLQTMGRLRGRSELPESFGMEHSMEDLDPSSNDLPFPYAQTRSPELKQCAQGSINQYHVCPEAEHDLTSKQEHVWALERALAICLGQAATCSQVVQRIRMAVRGYDRGEQAPCRIDRGRRMERLEFAMNGGCVVPNQNAAVTAASINNNNNPERGCCWFEFQWEKVVGGDASLPVQPSDWHGLDYVASSGVPWRIPRISPAASRNDGEDNDEKDLFADSSEEENDKDDDGIDETTKVGSDKESATQKVPLQNDLSAVASNPNSDNDNQDKDDNENNKNEKKRPLANKDSKLAAKRVCDQQDCSGSS